MAWRVDHLGKNSFHYARRFRIPTRKFEIGRNRKIIDNNWFRIIIV